MKTRNANKNHDLLIRAITVYLALGFATICALPSAIASTNNSNRPDAVKPDKTKLEPYQLKNEIIVKFRDGVEPELTAIEYLGIAPHRIRPYFDKSKLELDKERDELSLKNNKHLPQLSQYFHVQLKDELDAETVCDVLNSLNSVELVFPELKPVEPMAAMIQLPIGSEDDPTTTPDFTTYQKYFSSSYSPDGGVGLNAVQSTLGVAGKGIRIADIEYNWNLNHEDIGLPISTIIDTAPLYDPFPQDQSNHGTAVLGMLKGRKNAYGIDGFSPKAQIYLAPAMTQTYGYNVARAINLVAASLREGDVMLIEQQTYVCNGSNYGPIEWILPIFDAISLATAKGIVVIEPAGNGNQNLDDVSCEGRFDLSVRDSGALMIGAGHSSQHSRLSYSSYGLRVNLQGWGNSVASTGYGTLYDPGDILRRYTQYFNGTSSASAMVAGALTSLQGMAQGVGFKPLKPDCLNELVALTGSLQTGDLSTNIGQLPDLEAAMQVMVSGGLQCMERCTDSDGDLACDTIDNCATVTNPLQQTVNCTGNGGGRMKRIPY